MGKPVWLKRALAAYAAALFAFDTGSDTYVGVDLYNRCHFRYSASVLTFAGLPGLLTGGVGMYQFLKKVCGCDTGACSSILAFILGTLIGPFLFIPVTFGFLIYAIFKIDDVEVESKMTKALEMTTESFPQFIISLFMIQALQLSEPLNIFSCSVSALSVLYGLGDFLAVNAADDPEDYAFSKTVFGSLSICIDTTLRSMTLAYWMTISKVYVLIVPFAYTALMSIIILVKDKPRDCEEFIIGIAFAFASFACSSFEFRDEDTPRLRPISKGLFTIIFVTFSIFFGVTASPKVFVNTEENSINNNVTFKFFPSNCSNICQYNKTDIEQEAFEDYCSNLWEKIEPESFTHQTICIVIGCLFVLSLLEWILESCFSWMPYKKLYDGSRAGYLNKE